MFVGDREVQGVYLYTDVNVFLLLNIRPKVATSKG